MHAFLSNLAHRLTNERTRARKRKHNNSSVVGGKKCAALTGDKIMLPYL